VLKAASTNPDLIFRLDSSYTERNFVSPKKPSTTKRGSKKASKEE
jgi:hypothetical protein